MTKKQSTMTAGQPEDIWRNRMIGTDIVDADQLLANPDNWRIHGLAQQQQVGNALSTIGWVQSVIVNQRTQCVVDGHLRVSLAISAGQKVPVTYVDLSEDEEAVILAFLDSSTGMAGTDAEKLAGLLAKVKSKDPLIASILETVRKQFSDSLSYEAAKRYTRKAEVPLYEPSEDKPDEGELVDTGKYDELVASIERARSLTEVEKDFLKIAATRHLVFNYARIADYYAHGSKPLQRLMEESALIIIDFKRAIELGYVQMTRRIADLIAEENPDD